MQYPPSTSPSRLRSRHLIKISACPAEFRWKFLHASGGQLKSCSVNTHCFKKVPRSWGISCKILSRKAFEMISICGTGTLQMGIRIRDLAKEIAITKLWYRRMRAVQIHAPQQRISDGEATELIQRLTYLAIIVIIFYRSFIIIIQILRKLFNYLNILNKITPSTFYFLCQYLKQH